MTNTNEDAPFSIQRIKLEDLVCDKRMQVRTHIRPAQVRDLVLKYKAGTNVKPIEVVTANGALILVAGWHRVEALKKLKWHTTDAKVLECSLEQAKWRAAVSNMAGVTPLNAKEMRRAFGFYVTTRQHWKAKNKLKSYREIAPDIGRSHETIRAWMKADFPKIAALYSNEEKERPLKHAMETPAVDFEERVRESIAEAIAALRGLGSPEERKAAWKAGLQMNQKALEGALEGKPWKPDVEDF